MESRTLIVGVVLGILFLGVQILGPILCNEPSKPEVQCVGWIKGWVERLR